MFREEFVHIRCGERRKWIVGWESANKKSSATKPLLNPLLNHDSSKSQTFKTAPQPTRNFCSPFPRIGYASKTACRLRGNFQSLWLSTYKPFLLGIPHRIYLGSWYWEIQILFQRSLSYKSYVTGTAFQSASKICVGRQNLFAWFAIKAKTSFWAFWKNHSDSWIRWTNFVIQHKFLMCFEGHPSHITFLPKWSLEQKLVYPMGDS